MLSGAALNGLESHLRLVMLEPFALSQGIQHQCGNPLMCQQLCCVLIRRVSLALVVVAHHQQHGRKRCLPLHRKVQIGFCPRAEPWLKEDLLQHIAIIGTSSGHTGCQRGRRFRKTGNACQERCAHLLPVARQALHIPDGFPASSALPEALRHPPLNIRIEISRRFHGCPQCSYLHFPECPGIRRERRALVKHGFHPAAPVIE